MQINFKGMGCEDVGWIQMSNSIYRQRPSLFWDITRDRLQVGKGKFHSRTDHEGPTGSLLNLGARWWWVVNVTPRPLYPRQRPGTHCTGGWVGPRTGPDRCGKSRPHRDSIPGPSSPCMLVALSIIERRWQKKRSNSSLNPLKPELNPICYFLALLGAHHFLHVSRIRVKLLTFRLLMS